MAVAYQSSRPTAGTGTSSAPSLPTGAAAGDLILIKIGLKTGTAQTWTVPSGYTNVIDAANGANVRVAWWWKTIAAGDVTTGTVSCSWTTSVAFQYELVRLTGHDTTTPFAGSLSPGTAPSVTGANGGELVVSIDEQQGGSGANYSAWTNSALEQWDSSSGTGVNISSGGATKDLTASGATSAVQATLAGSSQIWIGSSVAVSPAAATKAILLPQRSPMHLLAR
jgi:hypothetical protein